MAACVSCSSNELCEKSPYQFFSDLFPTLFPNLTVMRCKNCGLSQVDHESMDREKLHQYYLDNYRRDVDIAAAKNGEARPFMLARARTLAQLASRYRSKESVSKIIEIGAGYGQNLLQFLQVYPDAKVFADEINEKILPAVVHTGVLDNESYDIILMSHVLEHFISPLDMLAKAIKALVPNGILIIEVPNEGGDFVGQRRDGIAYHEPHITFFDLDTLRDMIQRNYTNVDILFAGTCGPIIAKEMKRRNSHIIKIKLSLLRLFTKSPTFYNFAKQVKSRLLPDAAKILYGSDYELSINSENDNGRVCVRIVLEKVGS